MWYCVCCQSQLHWSGDFDFSDYNIKGDGVVGNYTCPNCEELWYEIFMSDRGTEILVTTMGE